MTVIIIVCNNGLGHLKRVLSIVKEIVGSNNSIGFNIYTDRNKLIYFDDITKYFEDDIIKFIHFPSSIENYEENFLKEYEYELLKADYVWSDNLSFPIKYNDKCVLTGSFLWADQLNGRYSVNELKSLEQYSPLMIGVKYFSTKTVREKTNFHEVGLYNYISRNYSNNNSQSLLISCGNSQAGATFYKSIFDDIIDAIPEVIEESSVYLEPCLYDLLENKSNYKKATFSSEMYNNVGVAVIRPGLGTISELWSRGIKIFPFHETDNYEMHHNSNIIRNLQGDVESLDIKESIISAINHNKNNKLKSECKMKLNQLDFDGIEKTAELILNSLN